MSPDTDTWIVLERRAVSPQVDTIHGPYYDRDEADEYADDLASADPRSTFTVAYWTEVNG